MTRNATTTQRPLSSSSSSSSIQRQQKVQESLRLQLTKNPPASLYLRNSHRNHMGHLIAMGENGPGTMVNGWMPQPLEWMRRRRDRGWYMLQQIVRMGMRNIMNSNPFNANNWALLANELSRRGYLKQGFRCSVIANHMISGYNQSSSVPKSHRKKRKKEKTVTQIHHYHISEPSEIPPKINHENSKNRNSHSNIQREKNNKREQLTTGNKEKNSRETNHNMKASQKRDESQQNYQPEFIDKTEKIKEEESFKRDESFNNMRQQYNSLNSKIEEKEPELLTLQQEKESLERELKQVREKWMESLHTAIQKYRSSLLNDNEILSDLTNEKQYAWKHRHDQIIKQLKDLELRILQLSNEKASLIKERERLKKKQAEEEQDSNELNTTSMEANNIETSDKEQRSVNESEQQNQLDKTPSMAKLHFSNTEKQAWNDTGPTMISNIMKPANYENRAAFVFKRGRL
jgi:hypothetical protein